MGIYYDQLITSKIYPGMHLFASIETGNWAQFELEKGTYS